MAKRSVLMIVIFAIILCAMVSNKADAFGHCARCSGCYGYAGYYGGAGNCGLGWGACGSAWWFGYGGYGAVKPSCGCARRCHHLFPRFGQYGWLHLHKHRCGGGCGGCWNCSGWSDGCGTGGCGTSGSCGTSAATETPVNSKVISDVPSPSEEVAPQVAPSDRSASIQQSSFHAASNVRRDGSVAFEKGVAGFRQGRMREALGDFEVAASAEPNNALYHYYRALTMYDVAGAEAAQEALQRAVDAESREPVKNWGKRMERVQGRGRLWIEMARRNAGLVR